jgi:trans-2,3-dihydro-3-hydroxyanthranilate isomerase
VARHPYFLVDAFTSQALGGNPCAVFLDADKLSAPQMLALAREMNLSETAFVTKSSKADFGARYFTPQREIPLAGHPTLSVMRALLDSGRLDLSQPKRRVSLELSAGVIEVDLLADGARTQITMTQLKPRFLRTYDPERVLPLLGLKPEDLLPGMKIQTVTTGTPMLMVPLKDHAALGRAVIKDATAYKAWVAQGDFFSAHLFALKGVTPEGRSFARHLGLSEDGGEDPFTGSATGCMGVYLWRHGLIDEPRFVAEQGHWMKRPGRAHVEVIGTREEIQSVRVAGEAVTVIRGELSLP